MYNVLVADDHAVVREGIAYLINQQTEFQVADQTATGSDTPTCGLNRAVLTSSS